MNRFFRFAVGFSLAVAFVATSVSSLSAQAGAAQDPLVQVLVQKGILTADDARSLTGTPADQHDRLLQILKDKGVLSASEYEAMAQPAQAAPQVHAVAISTAPAVVPAVLTTQTATPPEKKEAAKPAPPTFIPAVAPLRVLQLEPSKPGGLVPDIKLGSGAKMKIYGFIKASAMYDSSSPGGNDFPLPGFLNDTGPDGSPETHIKARFARIGTNFEWPDASDKLSITGRLEADFEGNFTRVNNRNISSLRSSQMSIRLAWGRLDYKATDKTSLFALFGQDWTPFASSTLSNTVETTGLGLGFGTLYERAPQFRVGMFHNFGGDRKFGFGPEFAIVLPVFGNAPPFASATVNTTVAEPKAPVVIGGNLGDQLGYGERQGPDSTKPELEGRLVFQWQLDKAKGVAPAQIIFSGMHGNRTAIVPKANVPAVPAGTLTAGGVLLPANFFQLAFPRGATVDSDRYGWTAEIQLPTRFVTLLAKYYRGTDLRFFFGGQLYQEFNDPTGIARLISPTGTAAFLTGGSIDNASTLSFGIDGAGLPVIVPQRAPRSQGGFVELGFPLSRIFNADPAGRGAGWTMNLHYSMDSVFANDVRKLVPTTGGRATSDWSFINLQYKLNNYVTFLPEFDYYRTRAVPGLNGALPLFRGVPAAKWHDSRVEFATIFTF